MDHVGCSSKAMITAAIAGGTEYSTCFPPFKERNLNRRKKKNQISLSFFFSFAKEEGVGEKRCVCGRERETKFDLNFFCKYTHSSSLFFSHTHTHIHTNALKRALTHACTYPVLIPRRRCLGQVSVEGCEKL